MVGPTAIGKTKLSIALAQYFNTQIISSDSRQFFKEMSIGTAAPTKEELHAAKHHFIHHKSILDNYSVGDFEKDAIELVKDLFKQYQVIVMVGGSGLYVDAVTKGLDNFPEIDPVIRASLNKTFKEDGLNPLQQQLKMLDPKTYNTIDLENPHRLIRALEVCLGTGKTYSSFLSNTNKSRPFKTITVGLTADREIIYNRINHRVDIMMENGLLQEAKILFKHKILNSLNTVGYKELFNYFEGKWTLDFAVSEIKKNSRRFAKRQLTWFKRNDATIWFDYQTPIDTIVKTITTEMKTL